MFAQCPPVVAGQRQLVFLARIAHADLDPSSRKIFKNAAEISFDGLLADARSLIARGEVDRQRGLGDHRGATRFEGIVAGRAAADGRVDVLDLLVGLDQAFSLTSDGIGIGKGAAWRQGQRHLGLRTVIRRHEAGGQQRCQPGQHADEEDHRGGSGRHAVMQAPGGEAHVDFFPAGLRMAFGLGPEYVSGHHRCEHAGDHQREENRDHGGPPKLHEELADNAGHESRRQKHGDQREGSGNHRQADFVGRFHRCLIGCFPHLQMADDVFDFNNRVVDQNTDHQRQRQQRDHVDRETEELHDAKRRNDRQGKRRCRYQRRPPIAQEKPHHQHGQQRAFIHQQHRAIVVFHDGCHEIEGFGDLDVGMTLLHSLELCARAIHHGDFAGSFAAYQFEADDGLPVEHGNAAALGNGILDGRDLLETDAASVRQWNLQGRQFRRCLHGGDGAYRLLATADIRTASGRFLLH